jgi:N-acetylglutamate synthase-like GNAT family acetyltransferase
MSSSMTKHGLSVRDYDTKDRVACLELFDGNTPDFFAAEERGEYSRFLDQLPCPYLVVLSPEEGVVAAGGYYVTEDPRLGALAWGLVARAWHRRGVGLELLQLRIARLRSNRVLAVRVRTSQRSRVFFERSGFRLVRVVPQGYAANIDLVELSLLLHAA